MTSNILNVIIDERKQLSNVDESALLKLNQDFLKEQTHARRVFKDYLLSSEVFYIDASLN